VFNYSIIMLHSKSWEMIWNEVTAFPLIHLMLIQSDCVVNLNHAFLSFRTSVWPLKAGEARRNFYIDA